MRSHAALVAHATRLDESDLPLDAGTLGRISEVLHDDATRRGERALIEAFIAAAKPWEDDGATEANAGRPGEALLERGETMLDEASDSRAHLEGDPSLRRRVNIAWGALQGAALRHDYRALEEEAARRGCPPFHVAGHDALLGRVRSVRKRNVLLPTGAQRVADRVVEEDTRARKALRDIDAFFEEAERRHRERVRGSPWDGRDEALWRRAVEMDDVDGPYRGHLHAVDFLPGRFARARGVLGAEHDARGTAHTREAPGNQEHPPYVLDHDALAAHMRALTRTVVEAPQCAEETVADKASEAPAGAHAQRALDEFFAWCAFRELERERETDAEWNALDAALLDHAEVLHDAVTASGRPGDGESRRRIERARVDLSERRFVVMDDQLRDEAESEGTLVYYIPRYGKHLERAQRLHESKLPFSADARARFASVLRDDAAYRSERAHIEAFIAAAKPWRGDGASEANETPPDKALLEQGRTILEDAQRFRAHLKGEFMLAFRFRDTCGAVFGAAIRSDHEALGEEAARRGCPPFHAPGHDALLERVRSAREHAVCLPEDAQRVADRVVEEDTRAREALRAIDTFFEEAERRHRERVRGSPWGERDEALWRRAAEMDDVDGPYRGHLDAADFLPGRFARAWRVLNAEDYARNTTMPQSPEEEHERVFLLDYDSLAEHVGALTRTVVEAPESAEEPVANEASEPTARAHAQRALDEFFAWCAFRELERERESGNEWNALDAALRTHARVLYVHQTGDGPPLFDDAESHGRVVQAHADLEGQWFGALDEKFRREAAAHYTVPRFRRRYPEHLRRAQRLHESVLPFPDEARRRIDAVLREDTGDAEDVCRIDRFAEDVRDWERRRTPDTQWDEAGERLLARGRGASEDIPLFYEHLASEMRLSSAFAKALGTLEGAKFVSAHACVQALANERRTEPRRLGEYPKLCLHARTLKADASIILPKPDRERVDEVLRHAPEARRGAVAEPEAKATEAGTAPGAQPNAGRTPQAPSPPPHETGPGQEAAPDRQQQARADETGWLRGQELPPDSVLEAQQDMAMEEYHRQRKKALKRADEKREAEEESATRRKPGMGMGP